MNLTRNSSSEPAAVDRGLAGPTADTGELEDARIQGAPPTVGLTSGGPASGSSGCQGRAKLPRLPFHRSKPEAKRPLEGACGSRRGRATPRTHRPSSLSPGRGGSLSSTRSNAEFKCRRR